MALLNCNATMICNATNAAMNCNPFDGDIAGHGVRVSFYVQNFILVLLVDRSYEDAENALWTFIATSFGLTIAALVQFVSNSLSLLEGILVSQLAWFANIGTFLALASYSRSKGKDNAVKVAAVLQGYFSMVLTILMWVKADAIQQPQLAPCDLKLVFLFGWDLPALGSGRKVALAFAAITILVYTCVTFIECRAWWKKHGRSRITLREQHLEMGINSAQPGSMRVTRHHRKVTSISESKKKRPRERTKWLGTDVDPIFFGIIVFQIIVLAYFISTTELIINKNNAHPVGEGGVSIRLSQSSDYFCAPGIGFADGFGFGQVLALTVLIPSVIALYRAIRRNRIAKPQDEKLKPEDENSRTRENLSPDTRHHSPRNPSRSLSSLSPPSPSSGPAPIADDPAGGGLAPIAIDGGSSVCSMSTAN